MKVVLGPVPCKDCRLPITWNGKRWCDPDGWRHYCFPELKRRAA